MAKGNEIRILWRSQKGGVRRAMSTCDGGGARQVALIPPGETRATTDATTAQELAQDLIETLQAERAAERARAAEAHFRETEAARHASLHGLYRGADLATFAARHLAALELERSNRKNAQQWLDAIALMLDRAIYFFDVHQIASATPEELAKHKGLRSPRNIGGIGVPDVQAYLAWLRSEECWPWERTRRESAAKGRPARRAAKGGKKGSFGAGHLRHHLNALSGMFKRAISLGILPVNTNPVGGVINKPSVPESQTEWLEPPE